MFLDQKKVITRDILAIVAIYTITYGSLFISKAIMWDGWVWFSLLQQKDYATFSWIFEQVRILPHMESLLLFLDRFATFPFVINVLVFFSWLVAGLSIYTTLTLLKFFKRENIFFITLCFLCIPIYIVRYEPTLITYTLSNALFYMGVTSYFYARTVTKSVHSRIFLCLSVVLFVFSFFTYSFLVYYGAFLLLLLIRFFEDKKVSVKLFGEWIVKNIVWVLLPILFYTWKTIWIGNPYGLYADYNNFIFLQEGATFKSVTLTLINGSWHSIAYGFFAPFIAAFSILPRKIFLLLFLVLLGGLALLHRKTKQFDEGEDLIRSKNLLAFGCVSFVLAFGAYVLVGEAPNMYGTRFDMRHGLILALPASFITLALGKLLLKIKWIPWYKMGIIALFITYNFFNYFGIDMDHFKQKALAQAVAQSYQEGKIGKNVIVVFYDEALSLYNWREREFTTYDYTNILYEGTQDKTLIGTRWGQNIDFITAYKKDPDMQNEANLLKRLVYVDIRSERLSPAPTVNEWLHLAYAQLFNPQQLPDLYNKIFDVRLIFSQEPPRLDLYKNR